MITPIRQSYLFLFLFICLSDDDFANGSFRAIFYQNIATNWLDQRLIVFSSFSVDNIQQIRGYFEQAEYFHEVECTSGKAKTSILIWDDLRFFGDQLLKQHSEKAL